HQQPEQQQIADDQRDAWQATAKDEQRQDPADEGRERDAPPPEERNELAHPAGGPRCAAMRRATASSRSARIHSSTSRPAAWVRRWAETSSSASARTSALSAQISRSTRAMEASPSATPMIVATYCSLIIARERRAAGRGRGPARPARRRRRWSRPAPCPASGCPSAWPA